MGRKPVPENERVEHITIALPKQLIIDIREHGKYNLLIKTLLLDYFRKLKNL